MTHRSTLTQALRPHLSRPGARLTFLSPFLIALFNVKTINLPQLSAGFQTRAKPESSYKRLQRFFREFPLSPSDIAVLVVRWMQIPAPWVLSLDRTTWEFGDQCHNFIVLGIVHEGMCHPILFLAHHNPISIKTHGRKSKSVFRLGFDHICHILLNPHLSTGDA